MTRTNDTSVDKVMQVIMRDPDYVIAATVTNNTPDVAARYQALTGKHPGSASALITELQKMRLTNKVMVRRILSVPWRDQGGSVLDTAVRTLRAEGNARLVNNPVLAKIYDPTYGGMLPEEVIEEYVPPTPGSTTGTSTGTDSETASFWESLPGILTAAGGLVGAFTGNVPNPGATTSGGGNTPPPSNGGSVMKTVLIILGIGVAITAVALIVRAVRKK